VPARGHRLVVQRNHEQDYGHLVPSRRVVLPAFRPAIGALKRTITSLTIDKRWSAYITSVLLIGRNCLAPGFHGNTP
jgi:hypothetical protein